MVKHLMRLLRRDAAGNRRRSRLHLLTAAVVALLAASPSAAIACERPSTPNGDVVSRCTIPVTYGQVPLSFVANQGQTDPRAAFVAQGHGYTLFLGSTEVTVVSQSSERPGETLPSRLRSVRTPREGGAVETPRATAVRMRLLGASTASTMVGEEQTGKVHYLVGDDTSRWLRDVPAYARLRSPGIYPDVDLVYYANGRQIEYDFVVKPGADPASI